MLLLGVKIWSILNILFYCIFGTWVCISHSTVLPYTHFTLTDKAAVAEFIAIYGGGIAALGVFLAVLFLQQDWQNLLLLLALSYFGYAVGRLIGILGQGQTTSATLIFFTIEAIGAIIGFILLYLVRKNII